MSEYVATKQVSLQEKIAELESRIAALEKGKLADAKAECDAAWQSTTLYRHMSESPSKIFGTHWSKMWEEFHEVMKEAFK